MRTLSDLALASQNAQSSDEVWLIRLTIDHANILDGPLRFVNNLRDLIVLPTNLLSNKTFGTGWSGITPERLGSGTFVILTDDNAADREHILISPGSLSSSANYTASVRIRKDQIGKATRVAMVRLDDGGGNVTEHYLDTSTGENAAATSGTGHVESGVLDDGDCWLVYITRIGATSYVFRVYPAAGITTVGGGGSSNAVLGSIHAGMPHLHAGTIADRQAWIAFPFQIDLPGEDPDTPSVARLRIDNVDRQIVESIRGLPSAPTCNIEVVLASQPEVIEIGFYDLSLRAADYDALYVEGQLTFEQIFTEPVSLEITPARFPGLF